MYGSRLAVYPVSSLYMFDFPYWAKGYVHKRLYYSLLQDQEPATSSVRTHGERHCGDFNDRGFSKRTALTEIS